MDILTVAAVAVAIVLAFYGGFRFGVATAKAALDSWRNAHADAVNRYWEADQRATIAEAAVAAAHVKGAEQ